MAFCFNADEVLPSAQFTEGLGENDLPGEVHQLHRHGRRFSEDEVNLGVFTERVREDVPLKNACLCFFCAGETTRFLDENIIRAKGKITDGTHPDFVFLTDFEAENRVFRLGQREGRPIARAAEFPVAEFVADAVGGAFPVEIYRRKGRVKLEIEGRRTGHGWGEHRRDHVADGIGQAELNGLGKLVGKKVLFITSQWLKTQPGAGAAAKLSVVPEK